MAYDPKRARGRTTAKHVVDADEPAPVDGLLDGKVEVPEWATEHDNAAIEVPVAALDAIAPVEPDATLAVSEPVEPEPAIEPEPAVEPEPVVEPDPAAEAVPAAAAARAPQPAPSHAEPPVAPVPNTPGSRWLFVAFIAAVLAAIIWQLTRRARR